MSSFNLKVSRSYLGQQKGVSGGIATLDSNAKVPSMQLKTMTGASSSSVGQAGMVPAPAIGDEEKFLRGDGSWASSISSSDVLNMVYPIGSIYMSVNSTSPASLFGGTWEQLKDQFLLGAGDVYTSGATGGASSVSYTPSGTVGNHTLTTSEIPSHNHTFSGTAVNTGNQSQGHTHTGTSGNQSANHTHTGTSGNPSANHTHSGPSHTHTGPSHTHTGPSHSHSFTAFQWNLGTSSGRNLEHGSYYQHVQSSGTTGNSGTGATGAAGTGATGAAGTGATGTVSAWHTHTTTTGNNSANHTHTTTTGGISANHTHSVTASGTIGNTGSGNAHNHGFTGTSSIINTMPPYLTVYMWKRTA